MTRRPPCSRPARRIPSQRPAPHTADLSRVEHEAEERRDDLSRPWCALVEQDACPGSLPRRRDSPRAPSCAPRAQIYAPRERDVRGNKERVRCRECAQSGQLRAQTQQRDAFRAADRRQDVAAAPMQDHGPSHACTDPALAKSGRRSSMTVERAVATFTCHRSRACRP